MPRAPAPFDGVVGLGRLAGRTPDIFLRIRGRLSGGISALRLGLVQVIDGALCVGSGLEDRPVVVLQSGKPGGDVGGVVPHGPPG
jgi:hypothetical protein